MMKKVLFLLVLVLTGWIGSTSAQQECEFDSKPPPTPTLILPPNGAATKDTTPTFKWSAVQDNCTTVTYVIEFNWNSAFDKVGDLGNIAGLTATTYTNPSPWSDHTKYWRVYAVDKIGNKGLPSPALKLTIDTIPPVLSVPPDTTVEATSSSGAVVTYTANAKDIIAISNQVVSIQPVCNPPSGSSFPVGPTKVTCSATDSAGNSVTASFTITVNQKTVTPQLITVRTDKSSYNGGETITISGTVSPVTEGVPVQIYIFNPTNTLFKLDQKVPNKDGTYLITITIGGKLGIDGVYTIKATYAGQSTQTTFRFTVQVPQTTPALPDLAWVEGSLRITDQAMNRITEIEAGEQFLINKAFRNLGDDTTTDFAVGVQVFDKNGTAVTPASWITTSVGVGQERSVAQSLVLSQPGTYILVLTLDFMEKVKESNEDNNVEQDCCIIVTGPSLSTPTVQQRPEYDPEVELQKEPDLKRTFVLGQVLVGLKSGVDPASPEVQTMIKVLGGEIIETIEEINMLRISVPPGTEQNVIDQLQRSDIVKFAGKNKYLVPTSIEIRDPGFSRQSKHYAMIDLSDAWSRSMGNSEVIVAVLDSGIDLEHPDLKANIWANDDACDDGVDNDSNGFTDDCKGWNFAHSNKNNKDERGSWPRCNGHGTHVSGIIAARTNEEGGLGVAPYATIMPLKVSGSQDIEGETMCVSDEATVSKAVIYAVDNGAEVINASLGCPNGEKCEMPALGDAFKYAHGGGIIVVMAAGNEHGIDDWQNYAQYVLEVSSVDLSEEQADYSNFGPGIELSAPGTTVYSTKIDGMYGLKTGTSQAAPMVSGCAALLLSVNQTLSNIDVEKILRYSANDIGDKGRDDYFGEGLLDCNAALKLIGTPLPELEQPSIGEEKGGGTIASQEQAPISVAIKHKKKVSLVSVKNNEDLQIFGFELKIIDGNIKFVKGRNWDRDRIDQSTVVVHTKDRPINIGKSLIVVLVVDNKGSAYQWRALDEDQRLIANGNVVPKQI